VNAELLAAPATVLLACPGCTDAVRIVRRHGGAAQAVVTYETIRPHLAACPARARRGDRLFGLPVVTFHLPPGVELEDVAP
jgi:hypothetical protein